MRSKSLIIDNKDRKKLFSRLMKYTDFPDDLDNDCWEWRGTLSVTNSTEDIANRYGTLFIKKIPIYSHRIAYCIFNDTNLKEGECVLHNCDNPHCINPNHLRVGTIKDNSDDKVKRLRHKFCEDHPHTKLSNDDVRKIKELYGIITQVKIADIFNVSESTISAIINGKTWKRLEETK